MSNDPKDLNDPVVDNGEQPEPTEPPPEAVAREGELVDEQDGAGEPTVDADTPEPEILQQEIESLQARLDEAEARAGDNWNRFLGAQAEMQNIRKRNERELQNAQRFALEKFIKELLPVKDSLEMGIQEAQNASDLEKLLEGSELTLKMFNTTVEKFGVQEIDPLGQRFDPERHEAMAMQPSAEAEPNTVLQVIRKGYALNDRVVRPAMVIVARAAEQHNA